MVKRVPISDSCKTTFICPKCKTMKTVDVSKFVNTNGTVKIKSKCSCGHRWISEFEKRKQYRKKVNFKGAYDCIKDGKVVDRGGMKVVDLSNGGAKVKLNVERNLQVGDNLDLVFQLDDKNATLIKKRVKIRSINGNCLGTTFGSVDGVGTELGFYLIG